ncbi:RWD domain-containing protein [Euphorbia peplus]|nr:RWD domain-containing protein [Euphorbia peplus]
MAEEEVLIELEALQSVYGDDCVIIESFPPHLHVHIKPRTADISSEQFVEAVIAIRAGPKYPEEPPDTEVIDSKGLDPQRQKHLIDSIQDKACELSTCLMLIALCEEAVEKLSVMNHPDGDCPLCLYPLVQEEECNEKLPFMKLMSCFHCFHSECIIRWWNFLQKEKESNTNTSSSRTHHSIRDAENQNGVCGVMGESIGSCPVCRKVFHTKDFDHVLGLVGLQSSELTSGSSEFDRETLESDSEKIRRQKFEAILKLQEENSGLIEPKKDILVLPGMYLPQPVTLNKEAVEEQQSEAAVSIVTQSGRSSNRPSSSEQRNFSRRMQRVQNSRKPASSRQWIKKEDGPSQ